MKENRPIPESIVHLRERVNTWRATRQKRGTMPEELWTEAVDLAGKHGIYAVSSGARLSYESLQMRVDKNGSKKARSKKEVSERFVQLSVPGLEANPGSEVAVVELHDRDGRSLTVRMMPEALAQLSQVATTLWGLP
jgi:hypothetical protein